MGCDVVLKWKFIVFLNGLDLDGFGLVKNIFLCDRLL